MDSKVQRKRAVYGFRILSSIQFVVGFLLFFFATYCIEIHGGAAHYGIPYYAGGHITAVAIIVLSIVGGAVAYIGRTAKTEILATKDVKPSMVLYIIFIPITIVLCVTGTTLTSIYGVTASDDKLSYQTNDYFNNGMAGLLFALELLALISTLCSIGLCCWYAKYFGVTMKFQQGYIKNTVQVRPKDGGPDENEIYVLQKWRQTMEMDVNFDRIQEYMDASRKPQQSQ